jgi:F0F1-type ATP synthase assembly protein I
MISSDTPKKISEDIVIKKELSAAFFRISLLTVITGLAGILIGIWLKNQLKADPLLTILPLLIGLPIVIMVNLTIIRRTLEKIKSQSKK